jgi:Starch-binding associating with outer membrane
MKKLKLLLVISVFSLIGCDEYLDINQTENTLLAEQLTPKLLLPNAQLSNFRVQATTMNQLGNVFMNSWTRNVQSFGNGFDRELQLNIDNTFYNGIFEGIGRNIINLSLIENFSNPDTKWNYYQAAAKILKVHYLHNVIDLYGDVPYTQAWKGIQNTAPAYDDDFEVYKQLFDELDNARELIANANPDVVLDMGAQDIMLGGNMNVWEQLANTIQLRMCLRMANSSNAQVVAFRNAQMTEIASAQFLTGDVKINPGFTTTTASQLNPYAGTFFYNVDGSNLQNRTFITLAGHGYKCMTSSYKYGTTVFNNGNQEEIVPGSGINYPYVADPRFTLMWSTGVSQSVRRAVTQGSPSVDVTTPTGTLPGLPSRIGALGTLNPYNYNGLGTASTVLDLMQADCYVMSFSEVCFLKAEAALLFPGTFSFNAQSEFTSGIQSNMNMRNVTSIFGAASVNTYLSAINTKPNFGWTGTDTQKLHAIMYQKWAALQSLNAIQSFIDYNKTGFPVTPLPIGAINNKKPYRLIYPNSEYIANSANVPSVTQAECFTINSKSPFWLQ